MSKFFGIRFVVASVITFIASEPGFAKYAAALNPVEPSTLCERFIQKKEKRNCEEQAKKLDLDWYAATVCDLIESDTQFLKCWADVDGKIFSPPDLIDCASDDLQDEERRSCLQKTSLRVQASDRSPASQTKKRLKNPSGYQPLEVKK